MNDDAAGGRRLAGTRILLGVVAAAAREMPRWALAAPGSPRAGAHERRFFARIVRASAIAVEVRGRPADERGTLFVANHIAWADVPVLGSVLDAGFVAKDEIAGWPLVGRLARRIGCIYVAREERGRAGAQAGELADKLARGGAILFPEGTTGDGRALLPFRTSLFAAAASARRVQPVVIAYRDGKGAPLAAGRLAEVAWGEVSLAASARLMARERVRAIVCFLDPIDGSALGKRKALAEMVRMRMAAAYAEASGQMGKD